MYNLLIKDYLLQKKVPIITISLSIFMCIIYLLSGGKTIILTLMSMFGIFCCTFISVSYSNGYEEKNNSLIILNSLPLKRIVIVLSKYISLIMFCIINTSVFIFFSCLAYFIKNSNIYVIPYELILLTFMILIIMFSIYYPLYFKFGYTYSRIFLALFYAIILSLPKILEKLNLINKDSIKAFFHCIPINQNRWITLSFFISIIVLLISLFLSILFYKNKDM
ncbi:ABC-2 transporter permease [Clostridium rectalis]|uniref:ABC-2 transporter permease n=1 Tax=Clostridium rectalis TaxID=2040295 RepID=UPI000F63C634